MLPKINNDSQEQKIYNIFKKGVKNEHDVNNKSTSKNINDVKSYTKIYPEFDFKMCFDGCSKNNPGLAGAGAVIYHHGQEYWSGHFFVGEMFTNNHAEYAGLIMGLQQAKEFEIKQLSIQGDSLLVINQMKGIYKCKSPNLIELYEKAKELETYFNKIEYNHVLRDKNTRADHLSNIAIEEYLLGKAF
jgi:ribonuclease HI